MTKIISERFYESREPQWLVESPIEQQSHFDQCGCVRQIQASSYPSHNLISVRTGNDLPSRSSYSSERQNVDRPALNTLNTTFNIPIVEFMVPLCCGKCEKKVKKELENDGVYKVVCDLHNQRVTVASNLDPQWLLRRVRRIKKHSHFWSGSMYLKGIHHVLPCFPSQKLSHHTCHLQTPAHRHRRSLQMSHLNHGYAAPRSSYDTVQTKYPRRDTYTDVDDPMFYYTGAEYHQTSFDAEKLYDATAASFIAVPTPINNSLHHAHLPFLYSQAYETENYPLHSTGYY